MPTTKSRWTDHLSTLALVVLLAAQVTMLSYGARRVSDVLTEKRTQLAVAAARR